MIYFGYTLCLSCLLFLSGCTASSPWALDSLASSAPDSKRLVHRPSLSLGGSKLEFYRTGDQISSCFSSLGRRLGTGSSVLARLSFGSVTLEEDLPLHEGQMRVSLPEEWTLKIIEALKEGQEVAILIGSIGQTILPDHFEQPAKEFFP